MFGILFFFWDGFSEPTTTTAPPTIVFTLPERNMNATLPARSMNFTLPQRGS